MFDSCQAVSGGAIYLSCNEAKRENNIKNCKFQSNKATTSGGAIYFFGYRATLESCTFANNVAPENGGADVYFSSRDSSKNQHSFSVKNCRFERSVKSAKPIFFLNPKTKTDFIFSFNTILIAKESESYLFNLQNTLLPSNMQMESNLISNIQFLCASVSAGFRYEIKDKFDKTDELIGGDDTQSNCPAAPKDSLDISLDMSNLYQSILYACDWKTKYPVNTIYCILQLYHCTFHSLDNSRTNGGAISILTSKIGTPEGTCIIDNCTFDGCLGLKGGAISISAEQSTRFISISNCSFTNNNAKSNGGAICFEATFCTIDNCTFVDNVADDRGSEIYFEVKEVEDTENPLLIKNCIFKQTKGTGPLIYFEWTPASDFFFEGNEIRIEPNTDIVLFKSTGPVQTGNLTCKVNCLLPSNEHLCDKSNTALYNRIKIGFQNTCPAIPDLIISEEKCETEKRCQNVNTDNKYQHVTIEMTKFNKFQNEDNGGAIYMHNTGLSISGATFTNCVSKTGGGGGIFIYNDLDMANDASLASLKLNSCQAAFGAGVYIYSSSKTNIIVVEKCQFKENTVYAPKSGSSFYGGSAVYLTISEGDLHDCTFINNHGEGGTIKVNENFANKPPANKINARTLNTKNVHDDALSSISISGCKFIVDKNSHSSLFFVNAKDSIKTEVKNCCFFGKLAKNAFHIDAQSNQNPNILVKSCTFSSDSKTAINTKLIKVNLDDQVFNVKQTLPNNFWILVASVCVICVAVATLIVVKKKRNQLIADEDEEEEKSNESNL